MMAGAPMELISKHLFSVLALFAVSSIASGAYIMLDGRDPKFLKDVSIAVVKVSSVQVVRAPEKKRRGRRTTTYTHGYWTLTCQLIEHLHEKAVKQSLLKTVPYTNAPADNNWGTTEGDKIQGWYFIMAWHKDSLIGGGTGLVLGRGVSLPVRISGPESSCISSMKNLLRLLTSEEAKRLTKGIEDAEKEFRKSSASLNFH